MQKLFNCTDKYGKELLTTRKKMGQGNDKTSLKCDSKLGTVAAHVTALKKIPGNILD